MRRDPRPAHGRRGHGRRHGAGARAVGFGSALALAVAALAPPALGATSAPEVGRTPAGEREAVTNWASDVATSVVRGRGREPVEASRVVLNVGGGAVVVQWSLSYDASVIITGGPGNRYALARVEAMAALERDGVEIARWALGENQAQGPRMRGWRRGTASGLFIDRTPGSGRKIYVLKVWNERAGRAGTVTVGTRAMICEER